MAAATLDWSQCPAVESVPGPFWILRPRAPGRLRCRLIRRIGQMRILFDKSAPYGLARHLEGHAIATAEERGWRRLENGALLSGPELLTQQMLDVLG